MTFEPRPWPSRLADRSARSMLPSTNRLYSPRPASDHTILTTEIGRRYANPTWQALERAIGGLEGVER